MRDIELIQDAIAEMLDKFVDRLRPMIKPGTCREYPSPSVREAKHVLKMDRVVRCLTGNQNQSPSFFQTDVRCSMDKIRSGA